MSTSEFEDEDGEGYFASISDLMVGILFVFLLMLTVFALNFRDAEDDQKVAQKEYDKQLAVVSAARHRAITDRQQANHMTYAENNLKQKADGEARKNADLRILLGQAVARINQDIRDRDQARIDLLADLTKSLSDNDMTVILDPDSVVLRLLESLLFDSGQASLGGGPDAQLSKRQAALDVLKKLGDALAAKLPCYAATNAQKDCEARDRGTLESVLIEGHADKKPFRGVDEEESTDQNDRLSVNRSLTGLLAESCGQGG